MEVLLFAMLPHMKIHIEKLVFGGQGLGRLEDGRVAFVWNALPGEDIEIVESRKKNGVIHAVADEVLSASPDRIEPKEEAYLSTSPWQMMTSAAEAREKVAVAKEAYKKLGDIDVPELDIVDDPERAFGYRNKMEFSFYTLDKNAPIELCFFRRGTRGKIPVEGSLLAEPVINDVAQRVVAWLNQNGVNRIHLESLIIRSNGKGEAIAALFVKKPLEIEAYPACDDKLKGFHVFFSNPKSPASVPTELLHTDGATDLVATVGGTELQFGLLSFFQVNLPIFEQALDHIKRFVDPDLPLVDFYSGVGSIGLPLSKHVKSVAFVESNEEAVTFARENAARNAIANVQVSLSKAEDAVEFIAADQTLVVDPPRAGLHKDVVAAILERKPKRVIYLSCNISTQARDVSLLLEQYGITDAKLFNFFPRTPHMEGLIVLDRME